MHGLSSKLAKEKLKIHGYNELPTIKPKSFWKMVKQVMKEPMFILLITSALLYIVLGDHSEGVILLCSILVIIFITFYQSQKTEKALESLKKLASPRALVIRDGKEIRIPGRELVPEDIIILHEGDRIAADAIILDTVNLIVDESLLTGESIPVTKHIQKNKDDVLGKVFSGTIVVQGIATAKVIATGTTTEFGKIGASLQSIKKDKTRLQKEMLSLIRVLFIIGLILSIGIVIAFYLTRGNFVQSLLNGLATAMAILPEEFPVVLTIFLALGAWRLSKKNVLTRNPSVIETLGSATVLCSDKTGTITKNKMEVTFLYNGKELFQKNVFHKNKHQLFDIINTAQFACQKNSIDPMEISLFEIFEDANLKLENDYKLLKEYPLTKDLFAMTRVLKKNSDNSIIIATKGAPEVIFKLCKLTKPEILNHEKVLNKLAEQGYRVIAVAKSNINYEVLPKQQSNFDLDFIGLIGLEDPIRDEIPKAIEECNEAGIKTIIITGDYPKTAKNIAKQIGLQSDVVITGEELDKMSDKTLSKQILNTFIFARVIPEQKLRIIKALKANNEIVTMTGDGVNDAPALKAAHIGIAMGNKGTDVAREASSLVLLDDNFASIVAAIRSGRRIFDNLQKAMSYITAIHIPIIGLTLIPAFIPSLPILLFPVNIVFMELIIDPVSSIAFEYEQEEKGIMNKPPRNPDEKFFGMKKILFSVFQGILLLSVVLVVYFFSINDDHSDGEVRAITYSSLIIGNIFLVLTNLSKTRSFLSVFKEKNYAVFIILSIAIIMLFLIITVPYLQHIFNFENPGYKHFYFPVTGAFFILFFLEIIKFFRNYAKQKNIDL